MALMLISVKNTVMLRNVLHKYLNSRPVVSTFANVSCSDKKFNILKLTEIMTLTLTKLSDLTPIEIA